MVPMPTEDADSGYKVYRANEISCSRKLTMQKTNALRNKDAETDL